VVHHRKTWALDLSGAGLYVYAHTYIHNTFEGTETRPDYFDGSCCYTILGASLWGKLSEKTDKSRIGVIVSCVEVGAYGMSTKSANRRGPRTNKTKDCICCDVYCAQLSTP